MKQTRYWNDAQIAGEEAAMDSRGKSASDDFSASNVLTVLTEGGATRRFIYITVILLSGGYLIPSYVSPPRQNPRYLGDRRCSRGTFARQTFSDARTCNPHYGGPISANGLENNVFPVISRTLNVNIYDRRVTRRLQIENRRVATTRRKNNAR